MTTPFSRPGIERVFFVVVIAASVLLPLSARSQDIEDLSLESLLETKISTAAKHEQSAREAPASVTVITAEDIETYGYRTLAEALQNVRGFYSSNDRNYEYAGVRGFSRPSDYNNRLLVMIDGRATNEPVYGSASIGPEFGIDMDAVQRVEIVRGPGSSLYGTNAMFAVVNVIMKNASQINGANAYGRIGSFGERSAMLNVGYSGASEWEVSAYGALNETEGQDFYFQEFDDPSTNNGIAAGLDRDYSYASMIQVKNRDLTVSARHVSRKKIVPTGSWGTEYNKETSTIDNQSSVELRYEPQLTSNIGILLRAYGTRYFYEGRWPYSEEEESWDSYEKDDAYWAGSLAQIQWDTHPSNRLIGGIELIRNFKVSNKEWDEWEVYSNFDVPYTQFSAFLQDEISVASNLALTGGLRFDSYSHSVQAFSPRIAAIYSPTRADVFKVLYGSAFRIPSAYEKYYEDEESNFKSNLDLKEERVRTLEFVWERELTENIFSELSVYDLRVSDLIDTEVDRQDSFLHLNNVGSVEARGVEAGFSVRTKSGISGYANFAFQRAKQVGSDAELSNSPQQLVKLAARIPLSSLFWGSVQIRYESERLTLDNKKTSPYWITNLNLGTAEFLGGLTARVHVNNIFDQEYFVPGGFEHVQSSILQDGRSLRFELSYAL